MHELDVPRTTHGDAAARRRSLRSSRAQKLVRLWSTARQTGFHALANILLDEGAADELSAALKQAGGLRSGGTSQMRQDLLGVAQTQWSELCHGDGCSYDVNLFTLALVPGQGRNMLPREIGDTLSDAGLFPAGTIVHVADGYYRPYDVACLSPWDLRAALTALACGSKPQHPLLHATPSVVGYSILLGKGVATHPKPTPKPLSLNGLPEPSKLSPG